MEFKLWKLPHLPRARIIRQIDPEDVIYLAFKSKPFRKFLQAYKLSATSMTCEFERRTINRSHYSKGFFKDYQIRRANIKLEFSDPDYPISFRFARNIYVDDLAESDKEKVVGTDWPISWNGCNKFTVCNLEETDEMKAMEGITKRILDIVHVQNFRLEHDDFGGVEELAKHFPFKMIDKFSLIKINDIGSDPEGFLFFIDKVETDKLDISIRFSYEKESEDLRILDNKVLKPAFVQIRGAPWLSIDHILNSECEILKTEGVRGVNRPEDILHILKEWSKESKLTSLKKLRFETIKEISEDEVLALLDSSDFVLPDRYKEKEGTKEDDEGSEEDGKDSEYDHQFSPETDYENWDRKIRRKTDGKIATFIIDELVVELCVL